MPLCLISSINNSWIELVSSESSVEDRAHHRARAQEGHVWFLRPLSERKRLVRIMSWKHLDRHVLFGLSAEIQILIFVLKHEVSLFVDKSLEKEAPPQSIWWRTHSCYLSIISGQKFRDLVAMKLGNLHNMMSSNKSTSAGCCLCTHYCVWVGEKSSLWLQRIQSSYADLFYKDADVEKHLIQAPLYYSFDQEDPRIWTDSSTSEECAARWWAKNSSVAPTTGSWRIW